MTHEQARLFRQRQQLADRAVKFTRVPARKVRARRAIVRHEQRVANEDGILDLIGHTGWRVAGRRNHFAAKLADLEAVAVLEQNIEFRSFPETSIALNTGRKIFCTSRMRSPIATFAPS